MPFQGAELRKFNEDVQLVAPLEQRSETSLKACARMTETLPRNFSLNLQIERNTHARQIKISAQNYLWLAQRALICLLFEYLLCILLLDVIIYLAKQRISCIMNDRTSKCLYISLHRTDHVMYDRYYLIEITVGREFYSQFIS